MHATLPLLEHTDFPPLKRGRLEILQVNLGYRCNQSCLHCHVNAGPTRTEQMSRETIDDIVAFLDDSGVKVLDITGGAPELHADFRRLVQAASGLGVRIIDRCNLTILNEPGFEGMVGFLARHKVEIVASLPCYLKENVESQRGKGVFQSSITALRKLNALGYGQQGSGLILNLMYNPGGAVLPPPQEQLEADYKRELAERAGIGFNQLLVLANMPIQRFGSTLISKGQFASYMELLKSAHQDANLDTVMCRSLISVDWQGYVYDCDFNQMLDLPLELDARPRMHIREVQVAALDGCSIAVADHCYGCTAGQGSSCGGALD
ncbi:MAG: arsenosugar biosynthesis radical SAM protein ArsS [Gammaproteobacteria bacterium]|nr:MAG: arsenosugar biosynthesis radical SAM protein ArsS [Gammaproteobacteria bacterium]